MRWRASNGSRDECDAASESTLNLPEPAGPRAASRGRGARSTPRTSAGTAGSRRSPAGPATGSSGATGAAPRPTPPRGSRSTASTSTAPWPTCATSCRTRSWSAPSGPPCRRAIARERWPAGPTPSSRRRSSTRSPAACSAPSASTPRSSTSTPLPGPRGARRTAALSTASGSATVDGEVIRRILERYEWSVPYAAAPSATPTRWPRSSRGGASTWPGPARSTIDDAPPGVLPEQGRLPGRPGAAGRAWSCRWCSRCCSAERGIVVDAVLMTPERGQHRLRVQLVATSGWTCPGRASWSSSSARSCPSSASTSCTPRSATTSTARPSCTAA